MKKVMIVDDEPDIIRVVREMLKRRDYKVASAESGKDALAKLEREKPDLILLDALMPGMDGWEVCKKIKEDKRTKDVPVVMYTIVSGAEGKRKSYEFAHADFHLNKPAGMEEILRTVERYAR